MLAESDVVTVVIGRFDPVVRRGLVDILREDRCLRVLVSDLEGQAFECAVAQQGPQVVILDEVAWSALSYWRSLQPATGVVVLARAPTRTYGMHLLATGATCLARTASCADILDAVHLTARGGRVFASADGHRIERRYPVKTHSLTPREEEVLEHLSRDSSYAQIALSLRISVHTVHTHVANVLRKLEVRSKRDLVGLPIRG
jgi:DNA-binding NarL/FixJ family response regulator